MLNLLVSLVWPQLYSFAFCFESVQSRFQAAHRSSVFKTVAVSPPAPSALPSHSRLPTSVPASASFIELKIQEAEGNVKETWSTINKLINKRSKTTTIQSLRVDGITIFDSKEIANAMNQFFCTVGEKLSNDIPETENPLLNDEYIVNPKNATFSFAPVTPKQLIETRESSRPLRALALIVSQAFFLKSGCLFWPGL